MSAARGTPTRARSRWMLTACVIASAVLATVVIVFNRWGGPSSPAATPKNPPATGSQTPTFPPDVTWVPVAGVKLPVSRLHGPRSVTAVTASGFTRSELGAALAAVNVLVRSSAGAGPNIYEPTITQQVTGANVAAMKLLADEQYERLRAGSAVPEGAPILGDAEVRGFRILAFGNAQPTARVGVVFASPDLRARGLLVQSVVQLQWSYDDWRVVAPPRGDWGAVTTTVSTEPAGMLTYDRVS
jgi:hypothetical protein